MGLCRVFVVDDNAVQLVILVQRNQHFLVGINSSENLYVTSVNHTQPAGQTRCCIAHRLQHLGDGLSRNVFGDRGDRNRITHPLETGDGEMIALKAETAFVGSGEFLLVSQPFVQQVLLDVVGEDEMNPPLKGDENADEKR